MSYSTTYQDVQKMFGEIAGRYDLANSVLSLGIHHLWRHSLLSLVNLSDRQPTNTQIRICDLCTGTGDLLPILHKKAGKVVGADFCMPMLQAGQNNKAKGMPLVQADALHLPFADASFDLITVAFGVRNFENTEQGLREIRRVLAPRGTLLVLEFGQPTSILFGTLFRFYSKFIMPLIGGLLTGNRAAYKYLPETSQRFPCAQRFEEILRRSGFSSTHFKPLTFGIAYAYSARV